MLYNTLKGIHLKRNQYEKTIYYYRSYDNATGCSYGKLIKEDIAIDVTKPFDPMPVITDLKEGASVEYQIDEDNSMVLVDITFKGKVQHIEREAELLYPQYSLKEDIVLDLVKGINQDDFITVEDGVEVNYELNEDDNSIIIF